MSNSSSCTLGDSNNLTVCLTRGQSIGLAVDAEAGLISVTAVAGVFVLIFIKVYRTKKLVQRPMDLFLIVLFFFDIIMALGRVTNIKWVQEGRIFEGNYCTAQGILQQFGETGSAMVTTVIAVYTFIVVMWGTFRRQLRVAYSVVSIIVLFLVIFIAATVSTQTHGSQHYMAPAGFWCWIGNGSRYSSGHYAERYAGEYIWIWVALAISVVTYVPLALVALGMLRVNANYWWKFELHKRGEVLVQGQTRRSISMIAYPVVYFIVVVPMSVVRWVSGFGIAQKSLPSAATLATECLFSLSGLANVLIFLFTRPDLLMGVNTEANSKVAALPPVDAPESSDTELAIAAEHKKHILPGVDDGGWTLQGAQRASESESESV